MVRTERDGRVVTLTLDNPPRNFIDAGLVAELDETLRQLESDRSVGAIVITSGHPTSFITHYDVTEMLKGAEETPDLPPAFFGPMIRLVGAIARLPGGSSLLRRSRARGTLTLLRVHRLHLRMSEIDKVVIAAINGHCAAGGCELALACDIRLMADGDFTIGLTEPVLGFNPGGGGGHRLVRAVGPAQAVEMLLEARHYRPREAVDAGLIHRAVDPDKLLAEAQATGQRLARRSPRAVWAVKRDAYKGFTTRWPKGLQLARTGFGWGAVSKESKAAMRRMLEQIDELPARETPSPWSDDRLRRQWQDGTVADLTGADGARPDSVPAPR
jgi:enoyl-CoA hydratase